MIKLQEFKNSNNEVYKKILAIPFLHIDIGYKFNILLNSYESIFNGVEWENSRFNKTELIFEISNKKLVDDNGIIITEDNTYIAEFLTECPSTGTGIYFNTNDNILYQYDNGNETEVTPEKTYLTSIEKTIHKKYDGNNWQDINVIGEYDYYKSKSFKDFGATTIDDVVFTTLNTFLENYLITNYKDALNSIYGFEVQVI